MYSALTQNVHIAKIGDYFQGDFIQGLMQGQLTGVRWTRLRRNVIIISKLFAPRYFPKFALSCLKLQPFSLWGWKHVYMYLYSTYCVTGSCNGKIWFCPFQCDFCCPKMFFLQIPGRLWPLTMMAKWSVKWCSHKCLKHTQVHVYACLLSECEVWLNFI